MKKLLAMLAAAGVAACGGEGAPPPAPSPDPATARTIAQGEVVGLTTAAGAHSWRGLPFAAPPVGDLRWRAPRPAAGWQGRREALDFAARCPQISNGLNAGEGIAPGLFLGDEDCLYLDIYAPPDAQGKKLPVMVWIHGGSNVWGRGSSYDGSALAGNEDVIVVPVQYRLGPLGYFSHEFLRAGAETPEDAAANFAALDLIAALKWVRENIAAFGGDPENVTIFGESAGGYNVAMLLASPLAKGLFHRAIIESGGFDSISAHEAEDADGGRNNAASTIAARLGAKDAADLRAIPVKDLFAAYGDNARGRLDVPVVIEDGVVLPAYSLREAFASTATFNAVPIVTGTNRDEMKFFHIASKQLTKKFLGLFLTPRDKVFYDAVSEYPSRVWRIRSVDGPAAMMAAAGHRDVYAYRFDWDEGGRFLFTDMGRLLGAGHAVEIPFVFNRFILLGPADRILFKKNTLESRRRLAHAMGAYWAQFARAGAPGDGGEGLPDWPRWADGGGTLMRFDSAQDGGIGTFRDVDTMARLIADLKADPRLSDEERCAVVAAIGAWLPDLGATIGAEVGC